MRTTTPWTTPCLALLLLAGGCTQSPPAGDAVPGEGTEAVALLTPVPDAPTAAKPGDTAAGVAEVRVTLGLPYKPDVQFTPIYVAQANGHFAARGLDVTLQYGDESQFVRLVAANDMEATVASGEQVILARGEGIPAKYVMTWYQRFAGVVFSLDPQLDTPEALVGRRVGLPAQSGASYIGWQALLASAGVDPRTVTTEVVGYDQLSAVLTGRVDAAVGYAANEPVQLRSEGRTVTVIDIAEYFDLVSNGLVVSDDLIATRPQLVGALVEALLLGLRDALVDPDAAFGIALEYVPEAADPAVRERQRSVLEASMPYWWSLDVTGGLYDGLGAIDADKWAASQDFLAEIDLLRQPRPVAEIFDDRFVIAARRSGTLDSAP